MSNSIAYEKSKKFAVRIIRLYQHLSGSKSEYTLSKQLLRSGTSIDANIKEALNGQSTKDFLAKMNIALKEAGEVEYWLELLHETEYLSDAEYKSMNAECIELIKLLTSIVKTTKSKI
ncbi:MAG: four helix bundle protein [Clostridiales bacterium]|nr:four helix bundle protein [Clostridiales bacterium]